MKKNSGHVFNQWVKGIELATGDFIWIAESDDWCETNFLETLIEGIQKYAGCNMAFAQTHCINDMNEILWSTNYKQPYLYINGREYVNKYMFRGNKIVNASMAIFRKESFNAISKDFSFFFVFRGTGCFG